MPLHPPVCAKQFASLASRQAPASEPTTGDGRFTRRSVGPFGVMARRAACSVVSTKAGTSLDASGATARRFTFAPLRSTDQLTSGRSASHGMPVNSSMSGQKSAGAFLSRLTQFQTRAAVIGSPCRAAESLDAMALWPPASSTARISASTGVSWYIAQTLTLVDCVDNPC